MARAAAGVTMGTNCRTSPTGGASSDDRRTTHSPRAGATGVNRPVGIALLGATVLTLALVSRPDMPYAVASPALHAAMDTATAIVGLLAAALAAGRFRRDRLAPDLALAVAFVVFGATNLLFSLAPVLLDAGDSFSTWASVGGRQLGAALFCLAAFLPIRRVQAPVAARLTAAAGGSFVLLGVGVAVFDGRLPVGVGLVVGTPPDALPVLVAHPVVTGVQAFAFGLFAAAAVGFWRRAQRGDELSAWLAAAAVLGAFARLHFGLFPSLYADVVYSGDVLRGGFYGLVLTGVAREVVKYWRELADAAVLEERRRMARDLHDGLAQELAFVATEAQALAKKGSGQERARLIGSAAVRALDESRRAIAALTRPIDEPLESAVVQTVEEIADRLGAHVHLDVTPGLEVEAATREALLRIVREAVTNAVRHGNASEVTVRLTKTDVVHLEIVDDGDGFDPAALRDGQRFGLVSMRERAASLGGAFRIDSSPGAGARVQVVLPP